MDLKEIIERNYQATVKRGLINDKTTTTDFVEKVYEEVNEAFEPLYEYYQCEYSEISYLPDDIKKKVFIEIADFILVGFAMAKHYNVDIHKALEEKTKFNEQRK